MIRIFKKRRNGFALLFAVFTASILMLIGVSIFSVSLRELAISQSAKDSQLAFYVADSARECALYWDIKKGAFPFCLGDGCSPKNIGTTTITCNGQTFDPNNSQYAPAGYNPEGNKYTFDIPEFFKYSTSTDPSVAGTKPMADLVLTKTFNKSGPEAGSITSSISTQGHNTGPSGRRLERGILQNY